MSLSESDYYLAFSCSPGIGPKRFRDLLRLFGSAKNIWTKLANYDELSIDLRFKIKDLRIGARTLEKFRNFQKTFDIQDYKKRLEKENAEFIPSCDKRYPQSLMQLEDTPIGLFVRGNVSCLKNDKTLAIVGTRKTTSYGRQVTESLVSSLVGYGFTTVSGLAIGIDAVAHQITIENNGLTIAILGCGVDCCYPRENQSLYDNIIGKGGLIISEYPLGVTPTKGSFPARNRIIAALSLGILVTEAGADSGSLITADYGLKLNKKVFAVPGPITSSQSHGTASLLKKGAFLVQSVSDITTHIVAQGKGERTVKKDFSHLSLDEQAILSALLIESMSFDELTRKTRIPIQKLSMIVSELEIKGIIRHAANQLSIA